MAKIVIYSKKICPYCVQAKNLLKRKGISDFIEIDITQGSFKEEMIEKSGGKMTVPQIFINDKHIGGFDDLYALDKAKKLDDMIFDS